MSTKHYYWRLLVGTILISLLVLPNISHAGPIDFLKNVGATFIDYGIASVHKIIAAVAEGIGILLVSVFGLVLALVSVIFDLVIKLSVVDFGTYVDNIRAIQVGWATLRNLANVFFIFIILFIALKTILQLTGGGEKQLLAKIIIVALLINFSAFFTKLVIDTSNVVANQFYSEITVGGSIATKLIGGIGIAESLTKPSSDGDFKTGFGALVDTFENLSIIRPFGQVFLLIITIVVFIAGSIMFMIRTVMLIILIILSPLAFMAYAVPGLQGQASKWWHRLLNEAFFAPLFLFFIFVVVKMIESPTFKLGSLYGNLAEQGLVTAINSFIVCGLMIASLIIAKNLGAKTASGALNLLKNTGKRGQTWVGRNTLGRASHKLAESEWMKQQVAKRPIIGGMLKNIADAGAKQKFGGKGDSFKDVVSKKIKTTDSFKDPKLQAQYIQNIGPGRLSQTLQRIPLVGRVVPTTSQAQEAAYGKLKPEQKLKMEEALGKQGLEAFEKVRTAEVIQKDREDLAIKYSSDIKWYENSTPEQRMRPEHQEVVKHYQEYQQKLGKLIDEAKTAPSIYTDKEKVRELQAAAIKPSSDTRSVLRRLKAKLSDADRGKLDKTIKNKKRDSRIKELGTMRQRNPDQEEEFERLKQERKDDRDETIASRIETAAGKIEEGGEKGGEDKKKDEK